MGRLRFKEFWELPKVTHSEPTFVGKRGSSQSGKLEVTLLGRENRQEGPDCSELPGGDLALLKMSEV